MKQNKLRFNLNEKLHVHVFENFNYYRVKALMFVQFKTFQKQNVCWNFKS